MRWIVRLVVLVLLAVVVGRLRERHVGLAATEDDLSVERRSIAQTEGYVGDLGARVDELANTLTDLDRQVTAFEAEYPNGIPAAVRDDYERLLRRRNEVAAERNDLVARQRTALADYNQRVAAHNDHVEDANALAEESAPWRIVRGLWESIAGPSADE